MVDSQKDQFADLPITTLIDFLHEVEASRQAVLLPAEDVERLVKVFGPAVRSMGFWNKSGDGSVEIPMSSVTEAARMLDNGSLAPAVSQLESPGEFAGMMDHALASRFIETLSRPYLRQFQDRVQRFQETGDPDEADRLWSGVARDLFGA